MLLRVKQCHIFHTKSLILIHSCSCNLKSDRKRFPCCLRTASKKHLCHLRNPFNDINFHFQDVRFQMKVRQCTIWNTSKILELVLWRNSDMEFKRRKRFETFVLLPLTWSRVFQTCATKNNYFKIISFKVLCSIRTSDFPPTTTWPKFQTVKY